MIGEYTVKIGDELFEYTNANDIPKKFDHLIKFVQKEPPEPHTQEDHDYINTFPKKFKEVFEREQK